MDFYQFTNEAAVERESQKVLHKILSDKSYTNPEKISLLLSEYEKRQVRLDAQLSKAIKSQIESISQSRESVLEANAWMKEASDTTAVLRQVWADQSAFHGLMEDITELTTYENNLSRVIEQLTYFIDMES
jgi:glutamine synthetase adenylyltransferase